jgi:hypothetical protein
MGRTDHRGCLGSGRFSLGLSLPRKDRLPKPGLEVLGTPVELFISRHILSAMARNALNPVSQAFAPRGANLPSCMPNQP